MLPNLSDGSARSIPQARSRLAQDDVRHSHTTTHHLHHVKEQHAPRTTRLPLEDPGQRRRTGFGSAATPRGSSPGFNHLNRTGQRGIARAIPRHDAARHGSLLYASGGFSFRPAA
jgi:hypothetical protein